MAVRPTQYWLNLFSDELELERDPQFGIPQWRLDLLAAYIKEMETANSGIRRPIATATPLPIQNLPFC